MDGSQSPSEPKHSLDHNDAGAEFLTFCLARETYGVDILRVQEIRGYDSVTRLPSAPDFIKGVINLRGTIVPIVDLRVRFGCLNANGEAEYNAFTVTIVLHIGQRTIGTVVDSVSDVVEIPAEAIRPAPEMKSAIDATYIRGLAHVGERMVILLDIESLLLSGDMGLVN